MEFDDRRAKAAVHGPLQFPDFHVVGVKDIPTDDTDAGIGVEMIRHLLADVHAAAAVRHSRAKGGGGVGHFTRPVGGNGDGEGSGEEGKEKEDEVKEIHFGKMGSGEYAIFLDQ